LAKYVLRDAELIGEQGKCFLEKVQAAGTPTDEDALQAVSHLSKL
jgi:hypothetical protein